MKTDIHLLINNTFLIKQAILFILNSHNNKLFKPSKDTLEDKKISRYRLGLILRVGLILKSFLKFRLGLIFGETW